MPVNKAKLKALKVNMKRTFKDISEKKAPQFVNAVMSIGVNHSKELTPLEFGNLIGSITTDLNISNNMVVGRVTYGGGAVKYAAALEFGKWKPRPVNKKEGPATNMDAEPHFLKKGFEDPESQALIKKAEKIFKL